MNPAGIVQQLRAARTRAHAGDLIAGLTRDQLVAVARAGGIAHHANASRVHLQILIVECTAGARLDSEVLRGRR